jgi:hypothetical protein
MRSMTTPPSRLRAARSKSFRKGSGNSSLLASSAWHLQKSEYRRPRGGEFLLRARALGWTEIRAGIVPANHRSRRLFERAGFVELPAASGTDDAPIAMIRRLAP